MRGGRPQGFGSFLSDPRIRVLSCAGRPGNCRPLPSWIGDGRRRVLARAHRGGSPAGLRFVRDRAGHQPLAASRPAVLGRRSPFRFRNHTKQPPFQTGLVPGHAARATTTSAIFASCSGRCSSVPAVFARNSTIAWATTWFCGLPNRPGRSSTSRKFCTIAALRDSLRR